MDKMSFELPQAIANFLDATNRCDLDGLMQSFADDALVNDKHRCFWGKDAIRRWSEVEIVQEKVTLEVREVVEHYAEIIITAKIGGNFNKRQFDTFVLNSSITVLHGVMPQVLLSFYFTLRGDKIGQLIVTPIDGASPIETDQTPFYVPYP
jgi:hypothetical protein